MTWPIRCRVKLFKSIALSCLKKNKKKGVNTAPSLEVQARQIMTALTGLFTLSLSNHPPVFSVLALNRRLY